MATTEDVIILKVGTDEAVKSVGDLKENIKLLKGSLSDLEIGSDAYKTTLEELKVNQNALKDAMYATTGRMEEVAAAAVGASKSYNSLVHQMAALKEEWRATNDEARRNELGKQIADINQQLKDMDASVGNFQRNVGNYESGVSGLVAKFDEWGGILKQMPPTLGATRESIGKVGETMQLVGKQPILGIIGLLAPIIIRITNSLKDNATAMDAVKKLMASLQPVFDVVSGVLEGIAQGFAKAVGWLVEFVGESEGVKNVVSSIIGVGNSILQYLLTPIKTAVAAFKGLGKIISDVFKGEWGEIKTHAKETGQEIADAYKEGFSFKSNFEEGKTAGKTFVDGIKDNRENAKQAGMEVAASFKEGYDEVLERIKAENAELADEERAMADEEADIERYAAELEAQEAYQQESNNLFWQGMNDRLNAQQEAKEKELAFNKAVEDEMTKQVEDGNKQRKKSDIETAQSRMDQMAAVASATSGLLSSIADMYESDTDATEKELQKAKNLRIAGATIDMLSGVVTAISTAMTLGPVAGPIMGAINSAAVIAAGVANINKIKSQSTSKNGGGGGGASAPASVSAPAINTNIPTIRTATSASEEDRLNRMASPQKVYILQSDIEAAGSQSKAQVEESSF